MASGLVPRNVQLPSWLESGLASFLQHPKGPLFSKDTKGASSMVVGLAFGYGAPNYLQHRQYRELETKKELNPNPDVLLKNVLMDRYFEAVKSGTDIDPPPPKPQAGVGGGGADGTGRLCADGSGTARHDSPGSVGAGPGGSAGVAGAAGAGPTGSAGPAGGESTVENVAANLRMSKERLLAKADATSWALVYYLSRGQMDGLKKFYTELNRMPRDMRLDERVVLTTFCKCFNLMDRQKPDTIDDAAFKNFAEMWVRSMRNVPVYGVDIAMSDRGATGGAGPGLPAGQVP